LYGQFLESKDHPHVQLRGELLQSNTAASFSHPTIKLASDPSDNSRKILKYLEKGGGIARFSFSNNPLNSDLIAIARQLGTPMAERSNDVAEFVEDLFVLNVVDRFDHLAPVAMQPFSSAPLSIHTESSGNPISMQPRYILLYCVDQGQFSGGAATLGVSMADVAAKLSDHDISLLAQTRYSRCPPGSNILRFTAHGPTFSFRDFCQEALDWICEAPSAKPEYVNNAIGALLKAMYSANSIAIHWQAGTIAVIDNWRFFHGRSAARHKPGSNRWLKRIRILEAEKL
jgi:hypothetical protein